MVEVVGGGGGGGSGVGGWVVVVVVVVGWWSGGGGEVMIRWGLFQVYTYIQMIWVLEIAESHPSKKAPSFQCEKAAMILNFPLL